MLQNLELDKDAQHFVSYLTELTLLDTKWLKWKPSLIACSAVFLAKKLLKRPSPLC
jgi:hypothetical protein